MNLKQPAGEKGRDKEENGDVNQRWNDLDWFIVCVKARSVGQRNNHRSKPVAGFPPGVQRKKVLLGNDSYLLLSFVRVCECRECTLHTLLVKCCMELSACCVGAIVSKRSVLGLNRRVNKCGTVTAIQICYSASPRPRMHFNKFPFEPLPCSWSSAPGLGSEGILLAEMNPHRLTPFISKTALSLGLPLLQSPAFPQTLVLSLHHALLSPHLPTVPHSSQVSALLSAPILGTMKLFWLTVWPVE